MESSSEDDAYSSDGFGGVDPYVKVCVCSIAVNVFK
jgi:hypothetical protein